MEEYTPYRLYEFNSAVYVQLHDVTWRGIISDNGLHRHVRSKGDGRWFVASMNYYNLAEFIEVRDEHESGEDLMPME